MIRGLYQRVSSLRQRSARIYIGTVPVN